jgi:hypothetical protein
MRTLKAAVLLTALLPIGWVNAQDAEEEWRFFLGCIAQKGLYQGVHYTVHDHTFVPTPGTSLQALESARASCVQVALQRRKSRQTADAAPRT